MTEKIRLEVDDAELDAAIARMDEALLKRAELLDIKVPIVPSVRGVPEVPTTPEILGASSKLDEIKATSEAVEREIQVLVDRLIIEIQGTREVAEETEVEVGIIVDQTIAKIIAVRDYTEVEDVSEAVKTEVQTMVEQLTDLLYGMRDVTEETEREVEALITKLTVELQSVKEDAVVTEISTKAVIDLIRAELLVTEGTTEAVETSVDMVIPRLTAEILNVDIMLAAVEASVEATVTQLTAEILAVEVQLAEVDSSLRDVLTGVGMSLPEVDRATRMVLLRVPGLREVLRLLYQIKFISRALAVPGLTTFTGIIVILLYLQKALQDIQQKQQRLLENQLALTRDMNQRFITIEEAVRGYGMLPERYRSTVIT